MVIAEETVVLNSSRTASSFALKKRKEKKRKGKERKDQKDKREEEEGRKKEELSKQANDLLKIRSIFRVFIPHLLNQPRKLSNFGQCMCVVCLFVRVVKKNKTRSSKEKQTASPQF